MAIGRIGKINMAFGKLKFGEKMLFGIFALLLLGAVVGYIALEIVRSGMTKPMFPVIKYNFSASGLRGSELFRKEGCTTCHSAMRNGTNMSLGLDGIGSKYSRDNILKFLKHPEETYPAKTLEHGPSPKLAWYVEQLPEEDLQAIASFLSELTAAPGSSSARLPPEGRSDFIDAMVSRWAPDSWKLEYKDIRTEQKTDTKEDKHDTGSK
ncbi:MAG: cytochrome c [Pseudomonadota bacterium]